MRARVALLLSLAALVASVGACGSQGDSEAKGSSSGGQESVCDSAGAGRTASMTDAIYLGWADVTYSTADTRTSYLDDMTAFAEMAAEAGAPLLMDAFTGSPENTTDWPVRCDFSKTPSAFGGNKDLEASYLQTLPEKLSPEFKELLRKEATRKGSPLLNTLALSSYAVSSRDGARACVALFTDAEWFAPDFNVEQAISPRQRAALIERWAPRLKALRGGKVYVIGVGRGTKLSLDQLEEVRSVLEQLLNRVGAKLAAFDTKLAGSTSC